MDILKHNTIVDIRNPSNKIVFNNSIMTLTTSVVGNALCIKTLSELVIIENLPDDINSMYFASFWVKHDCVDLQRVKILTSPIFTLSCDAKEPNGRRYAVVGYKSKNYGVSAQLELWYHMSIGINGETISIYINGMKAEIVLMEDEQDTVKTTQGLTVAKTNGVTCLDELMISLTKKTDKEVEIIYQAYIPGIALSS